jgi:hypothetical protein
MGDSVMHKYSRRQVIEAGKVLAGRIDPQHLSAETLAAFRLAHDWRAGHIPPMRKVRAGLLTAARNVDCHAIIAARLKRLESIRRKLRTRSEPLVQIQDIAGARAIMASMEDVDRLVGHYRNGRSKFEVQREWDYVATPKTSGYRGVHLRLVCPAESPDDVFGRLFVEVQVRTRLQHAWATAVEAVGLIRREELKSGQGDPDWLRLFALMGSELASTEGRPIVVGAAAEAERRTELRALAAQLEAIQLLEHYNHVLHATEQIRIEPGAVFMIEYDYETRRAKVSSFARTSRVYEAYLERELSGRPSQTVTVEIDRVEDLRSAYPNYFLDVREFTRHLKAAVDGGHVAAPEVRSPTAGKWSQGAEWLADYVGRTPQR